MSKKLRENPAEPGVTKAAAKTKAPAAGTASARTGAPTAATAAPAGLAEGDTAPPFRLPRDGGAEVSLSDFAGRKLVIFFYPRANTPGCTREAIDFSRLADAFETAGASVLGVSADSRKAQENFRDKHGLTTPLLSDPTHAMLAAYGAWGQKSMYGKTFEGVLRSTVVIGADGRVAKVWRNVKVDGHAQVVLEDVNRL